MNAYLRRALTLIAALVTLSPAVAAAEKSLYRVEVIVFSHLDGRPDGRQSAVIEDFSELTDPTRRAASLPESSTGIGEHGDIESAARDRQNDIDSALELIDALARLEEDALSPALPEWPKPYLALESLSPRMNQALGRLERSRNHDILAWRAWHQPLEAGVTAERIRLHDDQVVAVDWIDMSPTGIALPDSSSQTRAQAHEPRFQYRLDGGLRLRQRQFMHLEVDLHWRTPRERSPWMTMIEENSTEGFEIHRLQQSRTVRPDRLEYFDSSWLGLLVLIEKLVRPDGEDIDDVEPQLGQD